MKKNRNKAIDIIIGCLLLIPIYRLFFVFRVYYDTSSLPFFIFLPIIVGLIILKVKYPKKVKWSTLFVALAFIALAWYFYKDTYLVDHKGWDGMTSFFLWYANTIICRIAACVAYKQAVGKDKAYLFFLFYVIVVVVSLLITPLIYDSGGNRYE